jgi:DnaJ-domain-containing protein 1
LEGLQKEEDLKKSDQVLRQVKTQLDQLKDQERQEALSQFVADGGDEADFDYRPDSITQLIDSRYRQLKDQRSLQLREIEKSREKNLAAKTILLKDTIPIEPFTTN